MIDDTAPGNDDKAAGGVSRRSFLKGVGVGAAAAGLTGGVLRAEENNPLVVGPGAVQVELVVNDEARKLSCEPGRTLLDALRDDLGLTGPKRVCDRGACGACTVLVDGVPHMACMSFAIEAAGKKITTVEGLGTPEAMHPIQQAFSEHDAQQCGFCTPGMVVTMAALLAGNPKASEAEIRAAVSGNLCRCGTYPRIVDAVRAVSQGG